jgi:hypothetical protein
VKQVENRWVAMGPRRWILPVLGLVVVAQFYAAQQLLAAELLFAILFLLLGAFIVILYLLGGLVEMGADGTGAKARAAAGAARSNCRDFETLALRHLSGVRAHK